MSTFEVKVYRLPAFVKHPNADTLFKTQILGYPVIFSAKNGYQEGDLVAYIPVDAVVPQTDEWSFLVPRSREAKPKDFRIRAKRLRGIFSMGLLMPAPEGSKEGDDVAELMGITKYDPPVPLQMGGEAERDPGYANKYTDIENYRRYPDLFIPGEEVICTEKIHGCNAMFTYRDGRVWVRSHREYKKFDERNLWWKALAQNGLEDKLRQLNGLCVFGEVFGANVQDLTYGADKGRHFFRAFDIFDPTTFTYLNFDDAYNLAMEVGIPWTPVRYRGPMDIDRFRTMIEEQSHLADNLCEGFVIRPPVERFDERTNRVILKLISERYHLRKRGTEYH